MSLGITKQAAAAALIAVLSFWAGFAAAGNSGVASVVAHLPLLGDGLDATPPEADVTDLWRAWNALEANFIETHASSSLPRAEERVWGAIAGLAASYKDPYTVFFPPEESKQFQENISGNFGGIGVEIDVKDAMLTVIAPLKDTPAEKAGIMAGDGIVAINGETTEAETLEESIKRIRGPQGTQVTLTLLRDAKTFDVTVVRDLIRVPESEDELHAESGVYSISLFQFTATAPEIFNEAFARFKASGSKKLIIDVRGNPGGYLEAAVDIASHFLPKGAAVVTESFGDDSKNNKHVSYGYGDLPSGTQVVVLIDGGSASASEILAGALKDGAGATLVGKRSFGKGSVQELITVGEGSLKITVARWLTPSGTSISDGGLKPDIEAERTLEDFKADKDPQMARAIEFLTTGK
jgi:carboxyl-terminal processing protease